MSRLGQYLQTRGLVTRDQIEEALSHQAVQGARLGTNLVDLGFLSIEQLADCLSDFHKVGLPPRKWLEKPQRAAAQRATRTVVERIRFIPLRLEGKVLHAAVLDPCNPSALDDLRFATGCRIEPYVLPEIWMHDWLLQLFKIPRGIRHIETRIAPSDPHQEINAEFAAHMVNRRTRTSQGSASAARVSQPESDPPVAALAPRTPSIDTSSKAIGAASATTAARAPSPDPATDAPPLVRLPTFPRQHHVISKLSDSDVQLPAELTLRDARSVRPPPIVMHSLTDLPVIDETFWRATPQILIEPVDTEPPGPPLRPSPPPLELPPAEAHEDNSPSELPELYPIAGQAPDFIAPQAADLVADPSRNTPSEPQLLALEPMAAARELSHWESALLLASDRERLIELSFSIAACFATRIALFTVHQGMVQGLRCLERGITRPVDGVLLPLDSECMLTEAARRNETLRSDPRARPLDLRVLEMLGDEEACEVALFPVAIKQRVVNVLYASNGQEPLGPIAFGALQLVAQEMGAAYGRLILSRKASATAG